MKNKVLIHTLFYQNYNYGGILQAYALYHKLTELGFECEELNYSQAVRNPVKKLVYRFNKVFEIVANPKDYIEVRKKYTRLIQSRERYIAETGDQIKQAFSDFMSKEFVSTEVYYPDTINNLGVYDTYIVGGDQVWNPEWTDSNFFFKSVKGGKKIGYSCSAGKSIFTKQDIRKLNSLVKGMDVVSVRETNFSDILTNIGVQNNVIADPVFLYTKEEWGEFAKSVSDLPEHYIFAYILGADVECRKAIKEFAIKNGLKIVSIPHVFRYYIEADEDFADCSVSNAGPREFVYLIKNANFVLTDSFHGTAFSLIFERQFLNFSRFADGDKKSLNARLKSVVEEYSLTDRMIKIKDLYEVCVEELKKIDYEECSKITFLKRESALEFLERSLAED